MKGAVPQSLATRRQDTPEEPSQICHITSSYDPSCSPYLSPAPSSADSSRSDRSQSSDLPPCVIPPLPAEIDNENEGDDVASVEQFKAETLEMFKSGAMELVPEDFVV
jgi:hypothetical protein